MLIHIHTEENITAGSKAEIEAKLDGLKLYSGTLDLCMEVLPQVNLHCPLAATQHNITVKTKIPDIAPRVSKSSLVIIQLLT